MIRKSLITFALLLLTSFSAQNVFAQSQPLSALPSAISVNSTDLFYDVQTPGLGGVKATATQIATFVGNNLGVVTGSLANQIAYYQANGSIAGLKTVRFRDNPFFWAAVGNGVANDAPALNAITLASSGAENLGMNLGGFVYHLNSTVNIVSGGSSQWINGSYANMNMSPGGYAFTGSPGAAVVQGILVSGGGGLYQLPNINSYQGISFRDDSIQNNQNDWAFQVGGPGTGSGILLIDHMLWAGGTNGGFLQNWQDTMMVTNCYCSAESSGAYVNGYAVENHGGMLDWHDNGEDAVGQGLGFGGTKLAAWFANGTSTDTNAHNLYVSHTRLGSEGGGTNLVDQWGTGGFVMIHDMQLADNGHWFLNLHNLPQALFIHDTNIQSSNLGTQIVVDPSLNLSSFFAGTSYNVNNCYIAGSHLNSNLTFEGNYLAYPALSSCMMINEDPLRGPNVTQDSRNLFPTSGAQNFGGGDLWINGCGGLFQHILENGITPTGQLSFRATVYSGTPSGAALSCKSISGNLFANAPGAGLYTLSFKLRGQMAAGTTGTGAFNLEVLGGTPNRIQGISLGPITPNPEWTEYRFPVFWNGSSTVQLSMSAQSTTGAAVGSYLEYGDLALSAGWNSSPYSGSSIGGNPSLGHYDTTISAALTNQFQTYLNQTYYDIAYTAHGLAEGDRIRVTGATVTNGIDFTNAGKLLSVHVIDANHLRAFGSGNGIGSANSGGYNVGGGATAFAEAVPISANSAKGPAAIASGYFPPGYFIWNSNPSPTGSPLGWIETNGGSFVAMGASGGVNCSGSPTASFATINGVVTHC